MTLGLKRNTVILLPHDPQWHANAQSVIAELTALLGNLALDIQHVGSTAIESMPAKPILDIAVGLRDLDAITSKNDLLATHGFIFRGSDVPGQLLYVRGDFEADTRTHHIHAVPHGGEAWKNYVAFRDYLHSHPDKAREYADLKTRLAAAYPHDRRAYTSGKQALIDEILKLARA